MTQTGELDLRRWVEASHLEYGSDPWCFIRELAQNSRDADSTRIEITCGRLDTAEEWITFSDNGKGMALVNAQAFLLKLYASSKDEAKDNAGTFGVGFWTVLLFKPKLILITSRTDDESWGLKIDHQLSVSRQEGSLESRGTSITLIRDSRTENSVTFRAAIMERVSHYCRFLTCRLSEKSLLTLCEGKRISSEFTLGQRNEFSFRSKRLRGVVALTRDPKVELLVKGIPVWQGCSLGELKQPHKHSSEEEITLGDFDQAPSFLIDAHRLKVSITRREVIHDQELNVLIIDCQKALSFYLENLAKVAFPAKWSQTLRHWFSLHRTRVLMLLFSLTLLIPLILYGLNQLSQTPVVKNRKDAPLQAIHPTIYHGSLQNERTTETRLPYQIRYSPPTPLLLRWFTAAEYDENKGWQYAADQPRYHVEELQVPEESPLYTFTLSTFSAEKVPLLLPALSNRFRLISTTPHPYTSTTEIENDLLYLNIPKELEKIIYQTYPPHSVQLPDTERTYWLNTPGLDVWPGSWQNMITQGRNAPVLDRLHLILRLMKANFQYQSSLEPVTPSTNPPSLWLNLVLESGTGDCDSINGFAVLLLRSLNIPARLIIGWQGQNGSLFSELHAWCEAYVNDHWTVLDYSAQIPQWQNENQIARSASPLAPFIIPISLILAGSLFLVFLVLLMKSRFIDLPKIEPRTKGFEDDPEKIRSNLIQTARSAVLKPRLWGSDCAIWDLHLLPSFPEPISLRNAVSAFNKGRLVSVTDPEVPPPSLTKILSKNRFIRFNNSATDEICRLLPKNIDLSELPWHAINLPQCSAIEELNTLLKNNPHGRWKIVEVDNLINSDSLRWFDLRPINGSSKAYGSKLLILIARNCHPPFQDVLSTWEWICAHHNGLNNQTVRRITQKLLRKSQ